MEIIKIEKTNQISKLIKFRNRLYCNNANYVAPTTFFLKRALKKLLISDKTYKGILISKSKVILGCIIYRIYTDIPKCEFCFLDCVENFKVLSTLIDTIILDMKENNVSKLIGPIYPEELKLSKGMLIDGFDYPPTFTNTYNNPYYPEFLEELGFRKNTDFASFKIDATSSDTKRVFQVAKATVERRYSLKLLNLNKKIIDKDIDNISFILQNSFSNNEEVIEIDEEIKSAVMRYRFQNNKYFYHKTSFILYDTENNEPVGYCILHLDYNEYLQNLKGRLRPFLFRKTTKNIKGVVVDLLNVVDKYKKTDVPVSLCAYVCDQLTKIGITKIETANINENEKEVLALVHKIYANNSKVYRVYQKNIE